MLKKILKKQFLTHILVEVSQDLSLIVISSDIPCAVALSPHCWRRSTKPGQTLTTIPQSHKAGEGYHVTTCYSGSDPWSTKRPSPPTLCSSEEETHVQEGNGPAWGGLGRGKGLGWALKCSRMIQLLLTGLPTSHSPSPHTFCRQQPKPSS